MEHGKTKSVGRPRADIAVRVGPRRAVVTSQIDICLLDLRRTDGNCRDRTTMTSRQLYTEDVDWPMMGRQFNDEDISVYFSLKKKNNKQTKTEREREIYSLGASVP